MILKKLLKYLKGFFIFFKIEKHETIAQFKLRQDD